MSHTQCDPTNPFTPDAPHSRLLDLVGSFRGSNRTFMDPSNPPDEATWTVEVAPLLGGRFVELDYAATVLGSPHAGRLLLGHHHGAFSGVWIDSFHTGTDAMVFTELPGHADAIALDGGYLYEGQRIGWRIFIRKPDADHIEIDHVHLMPGHPEALALETRLARVPA